MYFVMACVVFGVFALGFVLAFQGIVGHELDFPAPGLFRMQDPEHRAWSIHRNATDSDSSSSASA